ncbi:hypothetical protein PV325_002911 [Microctonus aethiopoides]|nr:hypothetical protein PV325_002911 [Microctonus aethiopoides]
MQEQHLENIGQVGVDTTELPVAQRQPVRILMTQTSRTINSSPSPQSSTLQNSVRPLGRTGFFANGVPTNLEEIRPIIAQAYSNPMALTSWFNVRLPGQQQVHTSRSHESPLNDTFVMNIDDEITTRTNPPQSYDQTTNHNTTENFLNNIREASTNTNNISNSSSDNNNTNNINNNNNNAEEQSLDTLPMSPESRELFQAIQNHLPFAALLILKCIYDHRIGTLCLFISLFVFVKTNNDLKREIAKQQNRSGKTLLHVLLYIFGALAILYFAPNRAPLFYSTESLFFWELLWSIIVTDFILKLITVALKTLLTCLPTTILVCPKRGKYYLWMEATSQFYRSTVPMYSWISYFKNAYHWPEMTIGFILVGLYIASKIRELISRWKFLQTAFLKFWLNVNLGTSPTKEELAASGGVCVICHEEYSTPVRLHCNHIFCENCVSTWLDRERTCPLCRTAITDDPVYRDGHTTHFIQIY